MDVLLEADRPAGLTFRDTEWFRAHQLCTSVSSSCLWLNILGLSTDRDPWECSRLSRCAHRHPPLSRTCIVLGVSLRGDPVLSGAQSNTAVHEVLSNAPAAHTDRQTDTHTQRHRHTLR